MGLESGDIVDSGIVLFSANSFHMIHRTVYRELLGHVYEDYEFDYSKAEPFILHFYDVFENSKKLLYLEEAGDNT